VPEILPGFYDCQFLKRSEYDGQFIKSAIFPK